MKLFGFRPENGEAAGDTMPFYWNGEWHIFYLKPAPGAWGVVARARNDMGHIVSKDLVEWTVLPDAFGPGEEGTVDGSGIWTGSVIEHQGTFHFYYTGYNKHVEGAQRICHATSPDLIHWTKDKANPIIGPDLRYYETVDWRDPYVFWDERERRFTMLICARENAGPPFRRGCVAAAHSEDLTSWKVGKPLWTPRVTHCMECPEVFRLGDYWYLVFSRYSEYAQTIYRVAETLDGPWESRAVDSLESRRFYAAKSASDGTRRITFAWAHDRRHHDPEDVWEWGGSFGSPHELSALPDGTLVTRLPPEVVASYVTPVDFRFEQGGWGEWQQEGGTIAGLAVGSYGYGLIEVERQEMMLDTEVEIAAGTSAAGVLLECRSDMSRGYFVAIEPMKRRVVFDRWPGTMEATWQYLVPGENPTHEVDNPLVTRPLPIVPDNGRYRLRLLRKGTLIEAYVGEQVALTHRIFDETDKPLGLFVEGGSAQFRNLSIRR